MGENRHFIEFLYKFQDISTPLKPYQIQFASKTVSLLQHLLMLSDLWWQGRVSPVTLLSHRFLSPTPQYPLHREIIYRLPSVPSIV